MTNVYGIYLVKGQGVQLNAAIAVCSNGSQETEEENDWNGFHLVLLDPLYNTAQKELFKRLNL